MGKSVENLHGMSAFVRLVVPFIRCTLVLACVLVGARSHSSDSSHGTSLLNSAGKSSVKDFYIGCFVATSLGETHRAGMRFKKKTPIASPSTKHHEYHSPMVDNRAVDEARKTGLDTSFTVGAHTGKYKLVDLGCKNYCQYLTVLDAKDMIPAGISYCKSAGTSYAAFIHGGQQVYCGNDYGIGGLADKSACSSNSTENAPTHYNAIQTSVCTGLPCGSMTTAAVYSTGDISFEKNPKYDAKLMNNWLSAKLTSSYVQQKQDGLLSIPTLDTRGKLGQGSQGFELVVSGEKAVTYCQELLREAKKKSCRLSVAFMKRTVKTVSKTQLHLFSREGKGKAKKIWNTGDGSWDLFVQVEKKALCQPGREAGQPDRCINTKACTPTGIQCATGDTNCKCDYGRKLATEFGMFGTSEDPQNYHKGISNSSSVQLSPEIVSVVALINSQICVIM